MSRRRGISRDYLLNRWTELKVYTTDGAIPIDNIVSEREMKRI